MNRFFLAFALSSLAIACGGRTEDELSPPIHDAGADVAAAGHLPTCDCPPNSPSCICTVPTPLPTAPPGARPGAQTSVPVSDFIIRPFPPRNINPPTPVAPSAFTQAPGAIARPTLIPTTFLRAAPTAPKTAPMDDCCAAGTCCQPVIGASEVHSSLTEPGFAWFDYAGFGGPASSMCPSQAPSASENESLCGTTTCPDYCNFAGFPLASDNGAQAGTYLGQPGVASLGYYIATPAVPSASNPNVLDDAWVALVADVAFDWSLAIGNTSNWPEVQAYGAVSLLVYDATPGTSGTSPVLQTTEDAFNGPVDELYTTTVLWNAPYHPSYFTHPVNGSFQALAGHTYEVWIVAEINSNDTDSANWGWFKINVNSLQWTWWYSGASPCGSACCLDPSTTANVSINTCGGACDKGCN